MNEQLNKLVNNPYVIPITVGVTSFGVGVSLGYFLAQRKKKDIYEEPTKLDLDLKKEQIINLEGVKVLEDDNIPEGKVFITNDVDQAAPDLGKAFVESKIKEISLDIPEPEIEPEDAVERNIFAESGDDWDLDKEIHNRKKDTPYVIHRDEFIDDSYGFHQFTLTYYAGDDIMCDEENVPVYNFSNVVGELLFGHGSGDPKVFYVRNEKNRAEYEIIHDEGLFSIEVAGLEIEDNARSRDLKHSHNLKFRPDD